VHRTIRCTTGQPLCSVRCTPRQPTVGACSSRPLDPTVAVCPVHTGQSGADCSVPHRTDRCYSQRAPVCGLSAQTVRCHTGQRTVACPVRLAVACLTLVRAGDRWRHSLRVPPGTSCWAAVPRCTRQSGVWAPDSPVCHRTVRCFTHRQSAGSIRLLSWTFLDLS
jgi:hypothetical protein